MGLKAYVIGFFVGIAILVVLDFIWLMVLARDTYQKQLGHILSPKPYRAAAGMFYVVFVLALLYVVIEPYHNATPRHLLQHGAVFGLACYATYNLTNWATLNKWPRKIVVMDILWGTFATACVTGSIAAVLKLLNMITLSV